MSMVAKKKNNYLAGWSDHELIDLPAANRQNVDTASREMMRRLKNAIVSLNRTSSKYSKTIEKLTYGLYAMTVVLLICSVASLILVVLK